MLKTIVLPILALFIALPMGSALSDPQKKDLKDLKEPFKGFGGVKEGFKESNSQKVDALFAQWDKTNSPGLALAVIKDGKTIYQRGYGMANLEYGLSITTATMFLIASLSKQFTAFCIFLLLQGGKLNLNDDIRQHVPEVPDFGKKITIRHLIHHTSGLREDLHLASLAGWREGDVLTESDLLNLLTKQKELNFEPGSQYLYCNTGYMLLSVVVKRVSGKSLRDYAKENVFEPLGMRHTQFRDDHLMVIPNVAASYAPNFRSGGWQHSLVHHAFSGSTNLHTTIEDLALWDRNFYEPRVGDQKIIDQMHESFMLTGGKEIDYAGGLRLANYRGLKTVGHSGKIAGYRTTLLRFPEQKLSVVILANASNVPAVTSDTVIGPSIAHKVADIYLAKEFDEEKVEQKVLPEFKKPFDLEDKAIKPKLTEDQLKQYVGSFYSEELEVLYQVIKRDGNLWVRDRMREFRLSDSLPPFASSTATSVDQFHGVFGEYVGNINLRFTRNTQKQVDGFTIDTIRVKHLKFVRAEIKIQK